MTTANLIEVRLTGENWMQKMLSMMNRGGDMHLKLSKMNFAGAGPAMMNHLAKEHHVASPHELLEVAKELGVHLIPCQMTMDLLGLKREDLVEGLEEPAGATKALADGSPQRVSRLRCVQGFSTRARSAARVGTAPCGTIQLEIRDASDRRPR